MTQENVLNNSLDMLLGKEFNMPTPMGKEFRNTNFISRYKYLCIESSKNIFYPDDSLDKLSEDIKKQISKTGLSKEELFIKIEEERYKLSREKKHGGFANTIVPTIIKTFGLVAIIFFSVTEINLLSIIKYLYQKSGYILGTLIILLLALIFFMYKTFTSSKYEDISNKYHEFLIKIILLNEIK